MFWFLTPETYPLGSLSILSCFAVAAWAERGTTPKLPFIMTAAFSLSITVTNWMAGLVTIAAYQRRWTALKCALSSLAIVIAIWAVQKVIFPWPGRFFLLPGALFGEKDFLFHAASSTWFHRMAGLVFHAMVMPEAYPTEFRASAGPLLSVQTSIPGAAGTINGIATALWIAVLSMGLMSMAKRSDQNRFRFCLFAFAAGQLALHSVYGDDHFLYAIHQVPWLVLVAGFSVHSSAANRVRRVLLLALLLAVLANNCVQMSAVLSIPVTNVDLPLVTTDLGVAN